ncbi:bacitracin amidohydrolase BahA [Paenibacillus lautus]|uniref:bacitracin amidohydrolase BahA n=1 Tax=Paenibacillus lautus TaxID=1401 RepID=UPI002DB63F60|nr:bacitracin amidohydrolase BahA [Paenibacillus lautus]MEC0311110.1 bacitracin amidohydrolase BahA [Paenibacillus lautus]
METQKEKEFEKGGTFFRGIFANRKRRGPLSPAWKGASLGLGAIAFTLILIQANYLLTGHGFGKIIVGTFLFVLAAALISGLAVLLLHGVKKLPSRYMWILLCSLIMLLFSFIGPLEVSVVFIVLFAVVFSMFGALVYKFATGSYKQASNTRKIGALACLSLITVVIGAGSFWLIRAGDEAAPDVTLKQLKTSARYDGTARKNPAEQGAYPVKSMLYGSPDNYRKEFNQSGSLATKSVDATEFVAKWSSVRTKSLGFGPDAMPLNGKVWYPEGEGTFPLVLIVHGNHLMNDYSDPGYEYLGKLMASKGYIFVSVDENFLNVSPYEDLFLISPPQNENPARGLLLLEHLKTWKGWNSEPDHPFYQKVDMERIALIGHSRGGEAIAIAAAFNKLGNHPDHGHVKFDYNFSIRSLISIAGTDGQYKPQGKPLPLQDVNYLALHGAHDMDVNSLDSAKQYHRIRYTKGTNYMKSLVYIYGANHGQFNGGWGRGDLAGLGNQLFNLRQIMPRDEQETIAKVFISSFLDATLKDQRQYREVFRDLGYAKEWLPDTLYIGNYYDSQTTLLADYQEDIDLQSTTIPGGSLMGENLQQWREEKVKVKMGEAAYSAVRLGWNSNESTEPASYNVTLPDQGAKTGKESSIVFSLADARRKEENGNPKEFIDFTITVEDKKGHQASLPLSHISKLPPVIEGKLLKWPFSKAGNTSEPVFQSYDFQLGDFYKMNPDFNPEQLNKIRMEFNLNERGTILLSDVGIRL